MGKRFTVGPFAETPVAGTQDLPVGEDNLKPAHAGDSPAEIADAGFDDGIAVLDVNGPHFIKAGEVEQEPVVGRRQPRAEPPVATAAEREERGAVLAGDGKGGDDTVPAGRPEHAPIRARRIFGQVLLLARQGGGISRHAVRTEGGGEGGKGAVPVRRSLRGAHPAISERPWRNRKTLSGS